MKLLKVSEIPLAFMKKTVGAIEKLVAEFENLSKKLGSLDSRVFDTRKEINDLSDSMGGKMKKTSLRIDASDRILVEVVSMEREAHDDITHLLKTTATTKKDVEQLKSDALGSQIDDSKTSKSLTWSSKKISEELKKNKPRAFYGGGAAVQQPAFETVDVIGQTVVVPTGLITTGREVIIKDWGGVATAEAPIIITGQGGETFEGQSQLEITASFGGFRLLPYNGNWQII